MSSNREFREVLLRTKNDTGVADPSAWAWLEPDSLRLTVGGTTGNGVYSITITPENPPSGTTSFVASFDRQAAETDTQIGAALDAALDVLLAVDGAGSPKGAVLSDYIAAVSNDSGVVLIEWKPDAPSKCSVTLVAPGTATITPSPDDSLFPITRRFLGAVPIQVATTQLEVTVVPIDSSGVTLDPNAATINITCARVIEELPANPSASHTFRGVSIQQGAGVLIGAARRFNANGGRFGVGLSTITGTITNLDALEVWVREVVS